MKKLILVVASLILNLLATAQVINGGWYENFDAMTVSQPPSQGWLSTGNFDVIPNHQGWAGNTLSCNLNSSHTTDSVFTPLFTHHDLAYVGSAYPQIWFRIYNWTGGNSVSPATLGAGDTCYFSIYKYSNNLLSSKEQVIKFHSGNYFSGTSGHYLGFPTFNVVHTDTFRIVIHLIRGISGDYWYDFDDFLLTFVSATKEINALSSIKLFPNPANDKITFYLNTEIKNIQINDIYGRTIAFDYEINKNSQHQIQFDSFLEPGNYFISVKTDNEIINSKFIKN